jgi:hypothetical protein
MPKRKREETGNCVADVNAETKDDQIGDLLNGKYDAGFLIKTESKLTVLFYNFNFANSHMIITSMVLYCFP